MLIRPAYLRTNVQAEGEPIPYKFSWSFGSRTINHPDGYSGSNVVYFPQPVIFGAQKSDREQLVKTTLGRIRSRSLSRATTWPGTFQDFRNAYQSKA